jgi:hypothetical protein
MSRQKEKEREHYLLLYSRRTLTEAGRSVPKAFELDTEKLFISHKDALFLSAERKLCDSILLGL